MSRDWPGAVVGHRVNGNDEYVRLPDIEWSMPLQDDHEVGQETFLLILE